MKAKRLIPVTVLIAIVIGCLLLFKLFTPQPLLLFKGYEASITNADQIAKLEFRNTTDKSIWLCCSGREYPLSPPLLERTMKPSPKSSTDVSNNAWKIQVIYVGSFFETGKEVAPGDSLLLDVPLHPGEMPKQVGISYFVGNFTNAPDFLNSIRVPLLNMNSNWRVTAKYYWERLWRSIKAPQEHEVWCADSLSFHADRGEAPLRK